MIRDRNVFVVRQQWIVGAEHAARIGGVKNRGEEIGKIADLRRHRELCFAKRRQMARDAAAPLGRAALVAQQARQPKTQGPPSAGPAFHQRIEIGRRAGRGGMPGPVAVHQVGDGRNVEHNVADRNPDPRRRAAAAPPEHPIGEILDREIAIGCVGGGEKASKRRIVSFVNNHVAHVITGSAAIEPEQPLRVQ